MCNEQLAPWVQRTPAQLEASTLAQQVIWQAGVVINDTAHEVGALPAAATWEIDSVETPTPQRIQVIAIQLCARTFNNPKVLQARSAGPTSERFADIVLTAMTLRPDEIETIQKLAPGTAAGQGGLFILPTTTGYQPPPNDLFTVYDGATVGVIAFANPEGTLDA